MKEFLARFTDDGSVGLFNSDVNDIYHSSYGALTEAYEKFILPSNIEEFLENNKEIKVLDICYGIGYNSKAFLNFIFEKNLKKKNNFSTSCTEYITSIDTDNILTEVDRKIVLHGVDIDKNLIQISPFIKQQKNSNNILKKLLNVILKKDDYKIVDTNFYISDVINNFILSELIKSYGEDYLNNDLIKLMQSGENRKFFDQKLVGFIKSYISSRYKLSPLRFLSAFLHNIYYGYLSTSYKNSLKSLKLNNIEFKVKDADARDFVKSSNIVYDFVFLDAFSPLKAPSLWSIEFFAEIYKHTSENCMILTYSNSAAIRNAFLKNKFYVGKIYNEVEKKFTGTIATKNPELIKYPLDEFDLGLINTKAGICFRDENLSLSNEEIIKNRKLEADNSNLISATKFKKEHKCTT